MGGTIPNSLRVAQVQQDDVFFLRVTQRWWFQPVCSNKFRGVFPKSWRIVLKGCCLGVRNMMKRRNSLTEFAEGPSKLSGSPGCTVSLGFLKLKKVSVLSLILEPPKKLDNSGVKFVTYD